MMDDVLAIQAMYGADRTTRVGNTVYGHGSTAGKDVYDFAINKHPILCLYDAGGVDTLNLSGSSLACSINLVPGSFSDSDGMTKNISIARNTVIENAVGGSGNDVIRGNDVANVLTGGAGDDKLYGGLGNDKLDGKSGADHMAGGSGNDIYVVDNSGDVVDETGASGTDKVMTSVSFSLGDATHAKGGVENLTLTGSGSINGTGNGLANVIIGNAAANVLSGGDGNDTLTGGGGADSLTGGPGADQFRFTGLGAVDTIRDFHSGQDVLVFSASGFGGGLAADHAPLVDLTQSAKDFAGVAGAHFVYEHDTASYGTLYWDANGGSGADAVSVAKLMNVASLSGGDFHIV
jgi:Ca2+-binding RTX toxin-like protein